MIAGSLVLGSDQRATNLTFDLPLVAEGNLKASNCGMWVAYSDHPRSDLHIPSRDKRLEIYASSPELNSDLETLDSDHGPNYKTKLLHALDGLAEDYQGMVINHNTSTHSSIALVARNPLWFWGLYDTQRGAAHLLWASDPQVFTNFILANPLRYLIFRHPALVNDCVFLPVETVCAKWWRWTKNGSALQAFNALERRLFGMRY